MESEVVERPPFEACRGMKIYRNTGELSFETRPQMAGTFPVTFLEWVPVPSYEHEEPDWMGKIINQYGRLDVVSSSLLSRFNI